MNNRAGFAFVEGEVRQHYMHIDATDRRRFEQPDEVAGEVKTHGQIDYCLRFVRLCFSHRQIDLRLEKRILGAAKTFEPTTEGRDGSRRRVPRDRELLVQSAPAYSRRARPKTDRKNAAASSPQPQAPASWRQPSAGKPAAQDS